MTVIESFLRFQGVKNKARDIRLFYKLHSRKNQKGHFPPASSDNIFLIVNLQERLQRYENFTNQEQ